MLQVLAILNTICVSIAISHGMGRHSYYLTAEQRVAACKYIYLSYGFSIMSTCFGKISVALFLLRLVGGGGMERWFYAGIVSLLVVNITCTAFVYAQCTPARALWDIGIPHKCWDPLIQQRYSFFQGCKQSISDHLRFSLTLSSFLRILGSCACALPCEDGMESQNEHSNQSRIGLHLGAGCFVSPKSLPLRHQPL
jgi:hypothetical protein